MDALPSPEGGDAHGGFPQPAIQISPKSPTSDATTAQLSADPDAPAVDLQPHPSLIPNQPGTVEIELGLSQFLVVTPAGKEATTTRPAASLGGQQQGIPSPQRDASIAAPASPPAATPAPAATPLSDGHLGKPISSLSPQALPFLPSRVSTGRPKLQRWTELSDSDDDDDSFMSQPPASYRDTLASGPASTSRAGPASSSAPSVLPAASPCTSPRPGPERVVAGADALHRHDDRAAAGRRTTRSRPPRRPCRPRAQLVHGLPLRVPESRRPPPPRRRDDRLPPLPLRRRGTSPTASRIPVHRRLGSQPSGRDRPSRPTACGAPASTNPQRLGPVPRRRFSSPDADGWQEVLQQQRRPGKPAAPVSLPRRSHLPAQLDGRCLNCLSYSHKVATCKLPTRCLRCRGLHHVAKNCKHPRTPPARQAARHRVMQARPDLGSLGNRCDPCGAGSHLHGRTCRRGVVDHVVDVLPATGSGGDTRDCDTGWSTRAKNLPQAAKTKSKSVHVESSNFPKAAAGQFRPLRILAVSGNPSVHATIDAQPLDDAILQLVERHIPPAHDDVASDPMLVEQQLQVVPRLSVHKDAVVRSSENPTSPADVISQEEPSAPLSTGLSQDIALEIHEPPTCNIGPSSLDQVVESSHLDANQASSAMKRLDMFSDEITVRISTPLMQKPPRNKVPAATTPVAAKRSSSRLANDKLAKIPVARRGEVLLMRRFDLDPASKATEASGDLNNVFHDGVSSRHANKVKDMFPFRKANMGGHHSGVIIA